MGIGSSHKLLVRLAVATVITAVFSLYAIAVKCVFKQLPSRPQYPATEGSSLSNVQVRTEQLSITRGNIVKYRSLPLVYKYYWLCIYLYSRILLITLKEFLMVLFMTLVIAFLIQMVLH